MAMPSGEKTIALGRAEPACRQIATYFEKQIWSGKFQPGSRMPTTSEIARQFNVNPNTVQQGFELLLKRGIVERRRKCGSFVSPGLNSRTVGIVFCKEIFTDINRHFFSVVLAELQREFSEALWDTKFYYTSEFEHGGKVISEMEEDLRCGKIRAIVEFPSNAMVREWLLSGPAVARLLCPKTDEADLIVKGLDYLAKSGYRRPAVIFNASNTVDAESKAVAAKTEFKRLDLKIGQDSLKHWAITSQTGFKAAKALFGRPSRLRPDSLLVANDNACRGVIYAALESEIAIPAQIGLITHRNKGIDIFSPVPLTCLEIDPATFAAVLVDNGLRKINGENSGHADGGIIRAKLVIGKSCGECENTTLLKNRN
jgi:DNA-binding LacI/PurR family transcriptional regulator